MSAPAPHPAGPMLQYTSRIPSAVLVLSSCVASRSSSWCRLGRGDPAADARGPRRVAADGGCRPGSRSRARSVRSSSSTLFGSWAFSPGTSATSYHPAHSHLRARRRQPPQTPSTLTGGALLLAVGPRWRRRLSSWARHGNTGCKALWGLVTSLGVRYSSHTSRAFCLDPLVRRHDSAAPLGRNRT